MNKKVTKTQDSSDPSDAMFLLEVITELDHSPWCGYWSNERCFCRWGNKIKKAKKWLKSFIKK